MKFNAQTLLSISLLILVLIQNICVSEAALSAGDPCIETRSASGIYDISRSQTDVFCWRIFMEPGRLQPKSIKLYFPRFNFDGDFKLYVYTSEYPKSKTLVGKYNASNPIPETMELKTNKVLLIAQGEEGQTTLYGNRDFIALWDGSADVQVSRSFTMLIALFFVFVFPAIFVSFTLVPCYKKKDVAKKRRLILILFLIGALPGFLLFALLLSASFALAT